MALSALLLYGCCNTPPIIITNTKVIAPDDNLLLDCIILSPPNKLDYINATMKQREEMLISYSGNLMNNSFICNKKFAALREWKLNSVNVVNKK